MWNCISSVLFIWLKMKYVYKLISIALVFMKVAMMLHLISM